MMCFGFSSKVISLITLIVNLDNRKSSGIAEKNISMSPFPALANL